jgi:hypothetical protein
LLSAAIHRRRTKILFPASLITDRVYMHYTTQIWV